MLSFAFTALSYLALTGYDGLALRHLQIKVPYRFTALASFASYAISFTLGFPLVTGAAVRYWIYGPAGLSAGKIASLTVVASITFWLGMGLMVGVGFLSASDPIADLDHFHPLANRLIGLAVLGSLVAYFVWITRMRWRRAAVVGSFKLPGPKLTFGQMALGVIDICSASAALYVLLPQDTALVSRPSRRSTRSPPCSASPAMRRAASACSRRRSLRASAATEDAVLASLLLFRGIYYIVPFIAAMAMLGGVEAVRRWRSLREAMSARVRRLAGSAMSVPRQKGGATTRGSREVAVCGATRRRDAGACPDRECGRAGGRRQQAGARAVAWPSDWRSVRARASRARRCRRAPPGDGERRSRDGAMERARAGRTAVRCLGRPARDSDGEVVATLITLRDQTEARRVERLRVDFIANASHELRTPLASLLGFIETLQGSARDDASARPLSYHHARAGPAHGAADRRPLSLSRIEQNQHLRPEYRRPRETTRGVVDALTPMARDLGVKIRLSADAGVLVAGDRDELLRVAENLIENAIKYGVRADAELAGVVDVAVSMTEKEAALSVRDYGHGIAPEHLPRLTERFYRVDPTQSRAKNGTGLGLAIVKHILTRHRGRLTITSRVDQGSSFVATVPVHPSAKP